ncbi:unnamed protein product [Ceratitis capitata]|uniref:(Mediterranean fruit fly) hypothetical protein n=1 Tax=Ceratitis capitata TaxID=7213 RepID=A0A811U5T2_CERCA|nr:unnamed protein product [Ceratitis capitata]
MYECQPPLFVGFIFEIAGVHVTRSAVGREGAPCILLFLHHSPTYIQNYNNSDTTLSILFDNLHNRIWGVTSVDFEYRIYFFTHRLRLGKPRKKVRLMAEL